MEVILVRHAQPEWSRDGRAQNDPRLTELGFRQADRLGGPASAWTSAPLFVSTMQRARQTAGPVSEAMGVPARHESWLEELRPGRTWHESPIDHLERVLSEARARPPDEWWEAVEDGESFREFHDRVWSGFERLLAGLGVARSEAHDELWTVPATDLRIVIVAHGGTNALILALLLGLEVVPWEWDRFRLQHASWTAIESIPIGPASAFRLRDFSVTDHLDPDMISV